MPKSTDSASSRPHTPFRPEDIRRHEETHFPTPQKVVVQSTIAFLNHVKEQNYILERVSNQMVFNYFGVPKRRANEYLEAESSSRRRHNDPVKSETRGRPRKITEEQLNRMEE